MSSATNPLPVVHADSGNPSGAASRVMQTVKSAVRAQESELKRWHRTFDANAKTVNFFFAGFSRLIKDDFKNINSTFVLLVCDLFHPFDDLAVELFFIFHFELLQLQSFFLYYERRVNSS